MKPRKKNKYITLIFSFLPGAAEMYMGFMKNGLSLLVAFILPFMFTGIFYGADCLALISAIIYIMAFFHARNLAAASDDEFNSFDDRFFWEEFIDLKAENISADSYKRCTAFCLILIGICGMWSLFREQLLRVISYFPEYQYLKNIINSVPRFVFSVFVIVIGVMLIKGKKKELEENNLQK